MALTVLTAIVVFVFLIDIIYMSDDDFPTSSTYFPGRFPQPPTRMPPMPPCVLPLASDTADVSVKALPPDQLEPGWDYYGLLGQNPPPKKKELKIVKS